MREHPCPSLDPLTDTPCVLLDDRLDHGSVGHIGVVRAGENVGWMPTYVDHCRWSASEAAAACDAGPRIPHPRRPPDDDPRAVRRRPVGSHA